MMTLKAAYVKQYVVWNPQNIFKTYKSFMAWTQVSPFERQGFPPAGKSLPVLTTLSSRFSRGTMPALFRMAFSGIYQYPYTQLYLAYNNLG